MDRQPVLFVSHGAPQLADAVSKRLGADDVCKQEQRGLGHGTWTPLVHLFLEADIMEHKRSDHLFHPELLINITAWEIGDVGVQGVQEAVTHIIFKKFLSIIKKIDNDK